MEATETIYTIYPDGWFGRTPRAKQHAYADVEPPYRGKTATAFCGVHGGASAREFKNTEGNAITCSKCATEVARRKKAR